MFEWLWSCVSHPSTKIFQRVPRFVIGWWCFGVPVTRLETLFQVYQLSSFKSISCHLASRARNRYTAASAEPVVATTTSHQGHVNAFGSIWAFVWRSLFHAPFKYPLIPCSLGFVYPCPPLHVYFFSTPISIDSRLNANRHWYGSLYDSFSFGFGYIFFLGGSYLEIDLFIFHFHSPCSLDYSWPFPHHP